MYLGGEQAGHNQETKQQYDGGVPQAPAGTPHRPSMPLQLPIWQALADTCAGSFAPQLP